MKIAPINNNYSNYGNHNCNTVKNPNFKGIWGDVCENTYNWGYSSYYEDDEISTHNVLTYYPFVDEPKSQIDEVVKKKKEELEKDESTRGMHIFVKVVPLLVTAKQYAEKLHEFVAPFIEKAEDAYKWAHLNEKPERIASKVIKKLI